MSVVSCAKIFPRMLSQDALYNALQHLDSVLKDMRRLVRHYKTPKGGKTAK